jgi:hypothetical protein
MQRAPALIRPLPKWLRRRAARVFRIAEIKFAPVRIHVSNWFAMTRWHASKARTLLLEWGVTAIGVTAALVVQTDPRIGSISPTDARSFFLVVGTLLGTMVVLAISLSVIPLQRAISISTPMAVRLYRDDKISARILVVLSLLSIASFVLALLAPQTRVGGFLISIQVAEVAFALDLVRLHFRRVARLLDIGAAVADAQHEAERWIWRTSAVIRRRARLIRSARRGRRGGELPTAMYESALYRAQGPFNKSLIDRLNHLGETARRATALGEIYGALATLNAIEGICVQYLAARQANLVLVPMDAFVFDSDISIVLEPAFEEYTQTSEFAIAEKSEKVVKQVIESFGRITVQMANLSTGMASLAYKPLWRLVDQAKRAQVAGLDEAVWTGIGTLANVCERTPRGLRIDEIHNPAIEALRDIALASVTNGSSVIANRAVDALLAIGRWVLESGYPQLSFATKLILGAIRPVVALSTALGRDRQPLDLHPPGSPAYDISNLNSLPNLVRRSLRLIGQPAAGPWISQYAEFVDFNDEIAAHLNSLANDEHLGGGFTLTRILLGLKEIMRIYVSLLRDRTFAVADRESLERQIRWYTRFCWSVFQESQAIRLQAADKAADLLAWIALQLWESPAIREAMLSNIGSIIESCCEKQVFRSGFDLADLLMNIEYIRFLAVQQRMDDVATLAASKLEQPSACSDALWEATSDALRTRREQLRRRLTERFGDIPMDNAEAALAERLAGGTGAGT